MPTFHSPDTATLEPASFGIEENEAVGRLVRACAEIEDAVTLFIATTLNIPPAAVVILIGQTAISKRLAIAKFAAGVRGNPKAYDKLFPKHLKEVIDCRNCMCHGAAMGLSSMGKWAFETARTEEPNGGGVVVQLTYSYATGDIQGYARWAEEIAAGTNDDPGIQRLREERQQLILQPSRRSQPKPKQGAKPQPQLRPELA